MIYGLLIGLALAQPREVAGVVVQMQGPADQPELKPIVQVVDAAGTVAEVPLHDDAEPPDDEAGDGVWSGIAMGLTGTDYTVRLPAGPDTWMEGRFAVADPWRPIVRFRPAPGGALVSFEPVAQGATSSTSLRSNPWQPTTRPASEAPSRWWGLLGAGVLVLLGVGIGRIRDPG